MSTNLLKFPVTELYLLLLDCKQIKFILKKITKILKFEIPVLVLRYHAHILSVQLNICLKNEDGHQ